VVVDIVSPRLEEKREWSGGIAVNRGVISRWGIGVVLLHPALSKLGNIRRDRLNADRPAPLASG
jgi:hypothetical protein